MSRKGNGAAVRWLRGQAAAWVSDECLYWPFHRTNGYGVFGYLGKMYYAHRFICELVHGPAPSDDHEAAHSCGRGHLGCVNPKHISWKTRTENQLDRAMHGTTATGPRGKLTLEQAAQILALKGKKTQAEIAVMFGVSRSNVSFIHCGKAWSKPPRACRRYEPGKGWRVRIWRDGRYVVIGYFATQEAACAAYEEAIGRKSERAA